ncbi:head-tail connector protein [Hafnia paralvei]|uniref:head-tail connector protein n=1 Tax=Hafnia paralvei TaxID=546367 RepID=UPI00141951A4|nr:head-tail connector protein [Hafnia paralvei]MBW2956627.1 head-tail connector protein [Hafnia paralvei]NIH31932.1 phage gp6-like head-tail connector protein [Hafnia paralvei]
MTPTIEELRQQCRIDDPAEDSLLTTYAMAARKRAENYVNRKIYDNAVPEHESEGLLLSEDIKLAIMLAVGFWYSSREADEVPAGFYSLLQPYRYIPL